MLIDYWGILVKGAFYTLAVGLVALAVATVLGVIVALARLSSRGGPLRFIAQLYTTVVRGVPDIVMILLVFYGVQILLNTLTEAIGLPFIIRLNPFLSGAIAIGFIFGAYMAETFRGAILAIHKGELDAAHAFGFEGRVLFFRMTLPQIIRYGLSSFTNNWLVLLKTTALVSVIGLNDIVRMANLASSSTKKPFLFYGIVLLVFLLYTSLSLWALQALKARYHFD